MFDREADHLEEHRRPFGFSGPPPVTTESGPCPRVPVPRLQNEFRADDRVVAIPNEAVILADSGERSGDLVYVREDAAIGALKARGFLIYRPA